MKVHFLSRNRQRNLVADDQVQLSGSEGKQRFILCGRLNRQTEIFYGTPNPRNPRMGRYSQVGGEA